MFAAESILSLTHWGSVLLPQLGPFSADRPTLAVRSSPTFRPSSRWPPDRRSRHLLAWEIHRNHQDRPICRRRDFVFRWRGTVFQVTARGRRGIAQAPRGQYFWNCFPPYGVTDLSLYEAVRGLSDNDLAQLQVLLETFW